MLSRKVLTLVSILSIAVIILGAVGLSYAGKPTVAPLCKQCHQPAQDVIRGTFVGVSEKFKTLQVAAGSVVWVIKYGDDLKITGADKLSSLTKEKEIGVRFTGDEKHPYAVDVSVKPPAKVPPEKLVSIEEMARLTALGPEKGNYVVVDSRPAPRYNEGHIPHAVSMPLDKFDGLKDKILPKEKNKLIIFYCGGVT